MSASYWSLERWADIGRTIELRELGTKAEYNRADASIEDDVRALIDDTVKAFGKLDVAVNDTVSPAAPARCLGPLRRTTPFSTPTVRGAFFSLKHELRVMAA